MNPDYKKLLKKTIELAKKGKGLVSPNPMVGAVIAKGNKIISTGYHKAFGMPHAEVEAIKSAGERAKNSTLYVNLEPCCHYGKTPPCTDVIISAGIKEVVCCMEDPNPVVSGKGLKILEENGIKVRVGYLEDEATELNLPYITYITKKRPYIILKWAQTIDGKIATSTGNSKWITEPEAREYLKKKRFEIDGILIGVNTVLKDNPSLDYIQPSFLTKKNILERKRYYKIVLDPYLKTPPDAKLFENEKAKVLIFVSENIPEEKIAPFSSINNCEIIKAEISDGKFKMKNLMEILYEKKIGIIMVEGGEKTLTSFWNEKLADRVMVFIGNKVLGGEKALVPIAGRDKEKIEEAVKIEELDIKKIGNNLVIEGKPCFQE